MSKMLSDTVRMSEIRAQIEAIIDGISEAENRETAILAAMGATIKIAFRTIGPARTGEALIVAGSAMLETLPENKPERMN